MNCDSEKSGNMVGKTKKLKTKVKKMKTKTKHKYITNNLQRKHQRGKWSKHYYSFSVTYVSMLCICLPFSLLFLGCKKLQVSTILLIFIFNNSVVFFCLFHFVFCFYDCSVREPTWAKIPPVLFYILHMRHNISYNERCNELE